MCSELPPPAAGAAGEEERVEGKREEEGRGELEREEEEECVRAGEGEQMPGIRKLSAHRWECW